MKDKNTLKVTKWDIFFQVLFFVVVIGTFPAVTIIVDYQQYDIRVAIAMFVAFMVMSFIIHKVQVKHLK